MLDVIKGTLEAEVDEAAVNDLAQQVHGLISDGRQTVKSNADETVDGRDEGPFRGGGQRTSKRSFEYLVRFAWTTQAMDGRYPRASCPAALWKQARMSRRG